MKSEEEKKSNDTSEKTGSGKTKDEESLEDEWDEPSIKEDVLPFGDKE